MMQRDKDFKIILLTKERAEEVSSVSNQCLKESYTKKMFLSAIENDICSTFIALYKNKIVGFLDITYPRPECDINSLAVLPEFRKKGVANGLLESLFSFAKEKEISSIALEVRESNQNAINLYNKFHFKKAGLRKNFYSSPKENALILKRCFE